jgi:hypothetical protein
LLKACRVSIGLTEKKPAVRQKRYFCSCQILKCRYFKIRQKKGGRQKPLFYCKLIFPGQQ